MKTDKQTVAALGNAPEVKYKRAGADVDHCRYSQTFRVLKVFGQIWSGGQCAHEYTVEGPVISLKEAKSIAGDFASIDSAQVEITEREIRQKTTTIELH